MDGRRLLNRFKLVKNRSELVNNIDYLDANQILDKLYSEGILTEEKNKKLRSSQEKEKECMRKLLDILERNIEFEDKLGKTNTFDTFLECLKELNLQDLIDLIQNCQEEDLRKVLENRERQEMLEKSERLVPVIVEGTDTPYVLDVKYLGNCEKRDSVDTSESVQVNPSTESQPQEVSLNVGEEVADGINLSDIAAVSALNIVASNPENNTEEEPQKPRKLLKQIGRELEKEGKRILLEALAKKL